MNLLKTPGIFILVQQQAFVLSITKRLSEFREHTVYIPGTRPLHGEIKILPRKA
jgi:hypothetical protein